MESPNQTILVPTDFTPVAEYAIEHAVKFSKLLNKEILLLHIIKKESEYLEATQTIQALAEATFKKTGLRPHVMVREGSIFSTIGEVSHEVNAELVIMGTHGMKGLQKVTGSWALKVIITSKAPFIVVQGSPKNEKLEKIVFPVDFKKETKEKIGWAGFIARLFGAKVYVYKSNFTDKSFVKETKRNLDFTEKFFKYKEVKYEIVTALPKKNFADQTIDYAHSIDADLILVTTTKSINVTDYILGASEQYVIANSAHIPVMCVNPRPSQVGSFSTSGG
jgi:nucleotide-binding universal stress UspA family protein